MPAWSLRPRRGNDVDGPVRRPADDVGERGRKAVFSSLEQEKRESRRNDRAQSFRVRPRRAAANAPTNAGRLSFRLASSLETPVTFEETDTSIPTKYRIVIILGPNRLSLLIRFHGILE